MDELNFDDVALDPAPWLNEAAAVDGDGGGMAPALPGEPDEAGGLDDDDALVSAEFFVEMAEQTVVEIWPYLEYDEVTRGRVAERLAKVIAKRGGEMPPWLLAYKEELQLAGVLSLVVLQTRRQIRDHERQEAQEADRAAKRPAVTRATPETYQDTPAPPQAAQDDDEDEPDPVNVKLAGGIPGFHA